MRRLIYALTAVLFFACTNVEEGSIEISQESSTNEMVAADESITCPEDIIRVGILISDGVYNTELTAPMDIFHHTKFRCSTGFMQVYTIAPNGLVVHSFEGLSIIPDLAYYEDSIPEMDVFVIPATSGHLDADLENDSIIQLITNLGSKADYVLSYCDGAFPLVKSGLVNGLNVTTFPGDQEELEKRFPNVTVHKEVSFVRDGKFITSVGGAKSFESALYLVEELYGKSAAVKTAEGMVIDWDLETIQYKTF